MNSVVNVVSVCLETEDWTAENKIIGATMISEIGYCDPHHWSSNDPKWSKSHAARAMENDKRHAHNRATYYFTGLGNSALYLFD